MNRFKCPYCKTTLEIQPPEAPGDLTRCPACRSNIIIPKASPAKVFAVFIILAAGAVIAWLHFSPLPERSPETGNPAPEEAQQPEPRTPEPLPPPEPPAPEMAPQEPAPQEAPAPPPAIEAPEPAVVKAEPEPVPPPRVSGIMKGGQGQFTAIVNGDVVSVGDTVIDRVGGETYRWRITGIGEDGVVFDPLGHASPVE